MAQKLHFIGQSEAIHMRNQGGHFIAAISLALLSGCALLSDGASGGASSSPSNRLAFSPAAASLAFLGEQGTSEDPGRIVTFESQPVDLPLVQSQTTGSSEQLAFHPTGQFLYSSRIAYNAPVSAEQHVDVFRVSAQGTVALIQTFPTLYQTGPRSIAVRPDGKFLYLSTCGGNRSDAGIQIYAIATDGTLTLADKINQTCLYPLVFDPSNSKLHGIHSFDDFWKIYSTDALTGKLTLERTVVLPDDPTDITIRPDGKFAYIGTAGDESIHAYRLADGVAPAEVQVFSTHDVSLNDYFIRGGVPRAPTALRMDPAGRNLYINIPCYNAILAMTSNAETGVLSLVQYVEGNLVCDDHQMGSISISPDGRRAFALTGRVFGTAYVVQYEVDPLDGWLTEKRCTRW